MSSLARLEEPSQPLMVSAEPSALTDRRPKFSAQTGHVPLSRPCGGFSCDRPHPASIPRA
jgi:hypothetical protein